jgi:hypothetical protein
VAIPWGLPAIVPPSHACALATASWKALPRAVAARSSKAEGWREPSPPAKKDRSTWQRPQAWPARTCSGERPEGVSQELWRVCQYAWLK